MIGVLSLLVSLIGAQHFCTTYTSQVFCDHDFFCLWDGTSCNQDTVAAIYPDDSAASYVLAYGMCATPVTDPSETGCYIESYPFAADENILLVYSTPSYSDYCSVDFYHLSDGGETNNAVRCPATTCELNSGGCYDYCTLHSTETVCTCVDDYATGCRCANDPWSAGCYPITTNAGMCDGRQVKGCGAIPFCNWNGSNCQPDWKCYYSYINGIYPNNVGGNAVCDNTSVSDGGAGCRNKTVDQVRYCTSDTITSTDEKCMLARADQAKCEAEGCEWVPAGTGTRPFENWCTEIGSGASVARVSSVLIILLSIMLTFL